MKLVRKLALAGAVGAVLAGCSSPAARINQSCRASGETAAACDCFSNQLATTLTPQQLNAVAASMDKGRQQGGPASQQASDAIQQELGVQGAMTLMGAAKQCGLTGVQG